MSPSLTIAIPVYNRTFGFEESLNSALAVRECIEILIVDDNSNHNEFEKLCSKNSDIRIRYLKNTTNFGVFGNWNRCAQLATSDFIAVLCSDDIIEADAYSRFQKAVDQLPELDLFFGPFVIFYDKIDDSKTLRDYPPGPISTQTLLEDAAENGAAFPVLSFIRRQKLLELPFIEEPHSGNDWLWIYSSASSLNMYCDSKPISYWRRHPNQDANLSQLITTDCWPLMYTEISKQLLTLNSRKANKANRRAKGVILSWLLNDKKRGSVWSNRLNGSENKNNIFINKAKSIADENLILKKILSSNFFWPLYYNIGRLLRKFNVYPGIFKQQLKIIDFKTSLYNNLNNH